VKPLAPQTSRQTALRGAFVLSLDPLKLPPADEIDAEPQAFAHVVSIY
jgi:hypothetical protein